MDARLRFAALGAALLVVLGLVADSFGASCRTQNFMVTAATPQLAQEICDAAEAFRRDLAIEWLGGPLPSWLEPCPITAQVAPQLGAGGATSFYFDHGRPHGWTMTIQGSRERVLDSVLPHEVTHTIFATHFGRPLPRWADEGACTTVEHTSEKQKQERLLIQFLTSNRGIAFNQMFAMKEYPQDVLPLYSQGYALARFLIAQGGKRKFVDYVGDGMQSNNWTASTKKHYGFTSLSNLQVTWVDWVRRGGREADAAGLIAAAPGGSAPSQSSIAANDNALADATISPVRIVSDNQPVRAGHAIAASDRQSPLPPVEATGDSLALPRGAAQQANTKRSGSSGSWYARKNERRSGEPAIAADHEVRGETTQPQSLSRPQSPEQSRQIILEWTRLSPAPPPASAPRLR